MSVFCFSVFRRQSQSVHDLSFEFKDVLLSVSSQSGKEVSSALHDWPAQPDFGMFALCFWQCRHCLLVMEHVA